MTAKPVKTPVRDPKKSTSAPGVLRRLMERYPEVELATLVEAAPESDDWLHETKFDGYRLLGFVADGQVLLKTRNGKDWTGKFPALVEALAGVSATEAVLDMEAVTVDASGKTSFQGLQGALGGGGNAASIIAYVFDLIHLDGDDLTSQTLEKRKERLRSLLRRGKEKALRYSDHVVGRGPEVFAKACEQGIEGIISKKRDSPYQPGRQKTWLKVKCSLRQEFIVIGYSAARSGERALGALYLGYRKAGSLHYAGKVGTGFSIASAIKLVERFSPFHVSKPVLTREQMPELSRGEWQSVCWLKPELLCEVSFTEWTEGGRIRHPSFQGLREDKDASEVRQEMPVSKTKEKAAPAKKALTATRKQSHQLQLAGVTITHPDRVISEVGRLTKGELAEYYATVAPLMMPLIRNRPLSLLRCPAGIDGECFYQRNPGKGLGPDVHPFEFRHNAKRDEYLYIEDEKGLIELIQMGTIEIHPWGAKIDSIDYPDRLIFDLDPAPELPFEAVKMAAMDLRRRLSKMGLEPKLKCTGGKGLHVTISLAAKDKWPDVKTFAVSIADEMVEAVPEAYIATMSKAKRTGKIFVDYFRNDYTATAIADYSVRARPGVPIAVPLEWSELKTLKAGNQFTIKDVLARIGKRRKKETPTDKGQRIPAAYRAK